MLSKRDQYVTGLSNCVANAQLATAQEFRQLWSHVADGYRTLLEFEDRYPTNAESHESQPSRQLTSYRNR